MMKSEEYKFNKKTQITDPLRVFFLCGTKFSKDQPDDKRNVLKSHLENKNFNYKVIILEEHFIFGSTTKEYLSYDEIFMKNLKDIELLTGLFSDKIIILHESISTAAELGLFASNNSLLSKTCLLYPDTFSVEEDKVSSFIRLAFLNHRSPEENVKKITFYPKVKENIISNVKTEYHTFFPRNIIPKNLSSNIDSFILEDYSETFQVSFKKQKFKPYKDENIISYSIQDTSVTLSPKVFRILLTSLFSSKKFRHEIRSSSSIVETVNVIQKAFLNTIKNTIAHIEGIDLQKSKIEITIKDNNVKLRETIGYFLYTLQAIGMLQLPVREKNEKVTISSNFKELYESHAKIIEAIPVSKFNDSL
ncbi:retron St85 family effector protein [Cytobacillus oceanisediminis]|uniref:retron St85 family effector protein n=1 Tax=Cytobacillus oceanisediminis TaxID=665099 RepID=UPI0011A54003|nr:retron St85 family effector protein [Cytobacillus oceanisediminis]